jgi:hypothetical protein
LTGRTAYAFATRNAIVHWTTLAAVFLLGLVLFQDAAVLHWFREAMLWFAFLLSAVATLQTFTSGGLVICSHATRRM